MLCYAAVLGSSMIHISNSTHRTRNYLKKPVIVIINDTVFSLLQIGELLYISPNMK